jgi:hypothetical protein
MVRRKMYQCLGDEFGGRGDLLAVVGLDLQRARSDCFQRERKDDFRGL